MSERMRERALTGPSGIDPMVGETSKTRHIWGTIKLKGHQPFAIDDHRYVGDGKFVEAIVPYSHKVLTFRSEEVEIIREEHPDGREARFPRK